MHPKLRPTTSLSLIVVLSLLSPSSGAAVQPQRISSTALFPSTVASQREWVPPGWNIEAQSLGDLNGDKRTDVALTLRQANSSAEEIGGAERRRGLLILLRQHDGRLRRAAFTERLLQCSTCGGAFYGVTNAPAKVTILKGILIVMQERGSRNVVEQTFRFKYDSRTDKFWLIGVDLADRDRATGARVEQSTNFLTGRKIVTESQFDERLQKYVKKAATESTVSKERIAIEQVEHEKF
jgi:hypothetical protein